MVFLGYMYNTLNRRFTRSCHCIVNKEVKNSVKRNVYEINKACKVSLIAESRLHFLKKYFHAHSTCTIVKSVINTSAFFNFMANVI